MERPQKLIVANVSNPSKMSQVDSYSSCLPRVSLLLSQKQQPATYKPDMGSLVYVQLASAIQRRSISFRPWYLKIFQNPFLQVTGPNDHLRIAYNPQSERIISARDKALTDCSSIEQVQMHLGWQRTWNGVVDRGTAHCPTNTAQILDVSTPAGGG